MHKKLILLCLVSLMLVVCAVTAAFFIRNGGLLSRATDATMAYQPVSTPLATVAPTPTATVQPTPSPSPSPMPTPTPVPRSTTTGKVYTGTVPPYRPVMVSIENAPGARPQTALNLADIIYEAPVEYAITRFHAIFSDQYPLFAGPVRSSRIYWMRLQQEWNCMYIHRGYGGPMFEREWIGVHIESYLMDVGDTFWRDRTGKKDVHTLMVNVEEIKNTYYGSFVPVPAQRFDFSESAADQGGKPFEKVALNFFYRRQPEKNWVTFAYDKETGFLKRYQDGRIFKTRTPISGRSTATYRTETEEFYTDNLLVQYADFSELNDADKHRDANLSGRGNCDYFIAGNHLTGYWERETYEECTRYYLADGQLVKLRPGRSWICIHPAEYSVSPVVITYRDGTKNIKDA